jgi:hypothetical protein
MYNVVHTILAMATSKRVSKNNKERKSKLVSKKSIKERKLFYRKQ